MISNRCYYALRAVLELSIKADRPLLSIAQIARAQGIPPRFLEGILRELKQAGIVESIRGKEGGYGLALPPSKIFVGQIIRLFEGDLIQSNPDADPPDLPRPFETLWGEAIAALSAVLDHRSFAAMVEHYSALLHKDAEEYII